MILIGIDQGAQGAICEYDTNANTVKFTNTTTKSQDAMQFEYVLGCVMQAIDVRDSSRITIEQLAVFPRITTANAAFNMGRTQGITESVIMMAKSFARDNGQTCDVRWVSPSVWKRKMGLIKKTKQDSKALAYEKAKALSVTLPKVMRHDCAEAFLLAIL